MKRSLWILIGLLLIALLAACQSGPVESEPVGDVAPAGYPAPAGDTVAYPEPVQESPAEVIPPVQQDLTSNQDIVSVYPGPQSGEEITWSMATAIILNGEVNQVLQASAQKATLVLKDGRSLLVAQPAVGDIKLLLQYCGDLCSQVQIND